MSFEPKLYRASVQAGTLVRVLVRVPAFVLISPRTSMCVYGVCRCIRGYMRTCVCVCARACWVHACVSDKP